MKLPRDLSGDRVVRGWTRLGFQQVRQEGSHARLVPGALAVTVPLHRTLAPKTLQSMLREAEITIDQLRDAL